MIQQTVQSSVIIDHEKDNYTNLLVAVDLMRSMVKRPMNIADQSALEALLGRISRDLSAIQDTQKLLEANHENLKKVATSIRKHVLLVGYTKTVIQSFIENGEISKKVLLDIYTGSEIKNDFKSISNEVDALFPDLFNR